MALGYFEELLRRSTDEEIQAISDFISDHESFTVYSDLSRRLASNPKIAAKMKATTPLKSTKWVSAEASESDGNTDSLSNTESPHSKKGLAWVMGLARIEFASVLAAFTTTPDPFVSVKPTAYELPAYKSLLADGVRMHYWSLHHDPELKKVSGMIPENPKVLSYSRRLGLARKMMTALAKAGMGELNPYQYRELASWKRDLDGLHAGLLSNIQTYLKGVKESTVSTSETTTQQEIVEACAAQLHAEERELKTGEAKRYEYK